MDTKEKILKIACELYLDEGYKGLSMRKVASRAEISATAIYRHFDSKESLHQQILIAGFQTFGSYLYQALDVTDPLQRLKKASDLFYQFATEQGKYYELLFLTMDSRDETKVAKSVKHEARTTFDFMIERVRECMEAGVLKHDDPEEVAMLLLSASNGFFGLHVSQKFKGSQSDIKARYDRAYERLLQGLAT